MFFEGQNIYSMSNLYIFFFLLIVEYLIDYPVSKYIILIK